MTNEDHKITFGTITPDGLKDVRLIKQSDIGKCPFVIMVPEHYRDDGSCKCDDTDERKRMIEEWDYTEKMFKDIPLRQKA